MKKREAALKPTSLFTWILSYAEKHYSAIMRIVQYASPGIAP